jgi:hypothetical protein
MVTQLEENIRLVSLVGSDESEVLSQPIFLKACQIL